MILGSGPNRIGQGIEFDYCCCHASSPCSDAGFETIMVNCNPETVSTDYDTSRSPLFRAAHVRRRDEHRRCRKAGRRDRAVRRPDAFESGDRLHEAGVPIIGTSPDSIDLAEDRKRFGALLDRAENSMPENGTCYFGGRGESGCRTRSVIRCWCGRAYVLGGRAMAIVYDEESLDDYMRSAVDASPEKPILIDKFLERAAEFDVDALADETACVIAGIQEHIEEAGIHSGDSSSVLPPQKIAVEHLGNDAALHANAGQGSECQGADEYSVCDQGRPRLCARGEPARVAHRAVCFQSDRRADARRSPRW